MFIGLVLVAVGAIALLVKMGWLSGSVWSYSWPVILIVLGLAIFLRRHNRHARGWCGPCCPPTEEEPKH